MEESSTFAYRMPARLDALGDLRHALRDWLASADVDPGTAEEVVLAAWEVCANAVEHPVERTGSDITLVASASSCGVRVAVRDTGSWRERTVQRRDRGLGLRLARATMDRMWVLSDRPGTEVVMWRSKGGHA